MENKLRYMGGVICEKSSIDQMQGNFSAFNIIDEVKVDIQSTDPTRSAKSLEEFDVPLSFQVISLWKRENIEDLGSDLSARIVMEVVDPNGKVLGSVPVDLVIPLDKVRARNILNVQGMKITASGEYCFQFREELMNSKLSAQLAKLYFDVNLTKK